MASPLPTAKQSVTMAASGARVSRIRRDPPPVVKQVSVAERNERDAWTVGIGIVTFTLALTIIAIALASYSGWSPRQYTAYF